VVAVSGCTRRKIVVEQDLSAVRPYQLHVQEDRWRWLSAVGVDQATIVVEDPLTSGLVVASW